MDECSVIGIKGIFHFEVWLHKWMCIWVNKRVYHHLLSHQYSLKYNPLRPHFFLVTSPTPKTSLLFVLPYLLYLCFHDVVTTRLIVKSKRNQSGGGNVLTGRRIQPSAMKKLPKPKTEISRWPKNLKSTGLLIS